MSGINVLLIHGPNLNLLGTREPETYGYDTLADIEARAKIAAEVAGGTLVAFQSNHEGALIDRIQAARTEGIDAIIINAGECGTMENGEGARLTKSRRVHPHERGAAGRAAECGDSVHRAAHYQR